MKLKRILVNRHKVRYNREHGTRDPVISVKTYNSNDYGDEVVIFGSDGAIAGRVVYRPDNPLKCGATVWVEAYHKVVVHDSRANGA